MPAVFLLRRTRSALLAAQRALFDEAERGRAERWTCVGASDLLYEALPRIAELGPDLIATDLRLTDGHALTLLRRLPLKRRPPVLLLTAVGDDPLLFDALAAGAQGYWQDPGQARGLAAALHDCAAGAARMSPALARQALLALGLPRSEPQLAHNVAAGQDLAPAAAGLARSEQHLLTLVAQGLLDGEIAQRWQLDPLEIGRRLAAVYAALHRLSAAAAAAAMPQAAGGAVSMKL